MRKLAKAQLLFPIILFLLGACTDPVEDGLPGKVPDPSYYHSAGWKDNPQHGNDYSSDPQNCKACHGSDLCGGSSGVSCVACHHGWSGTHGAAFAADPDNCKACHGADLAGGLSGKSCFSSLCHHPTANWSDGTNHGPKLAATPSRCKGCHGADLTGGLSGESCADCHHDDDYPYDYHDGVAGGATHIDTAGCDGCHGSDYTGGHSGVSCSDVGCHEDRGNCDNAGCHQTLQSHPVHTVANNKGPAVLGCDSTCHNANPLDYTQFSDGNDIDSTTVCNFCHSPNGDYNGVDNQDDSVGAKDNWENGVYNGAGDALTGGKEKWCVGCHDDVPANSKIDGSGAVDAPNVAGDDSIYGFYASGHGRSGADKLCLDCHDATASHIDGDARTYAAASDNYVAGYRLNADMTVPRNGELVATSFDLCATCHAYADLIDVNISNFHDSGGGQDHHRWHLDMFRANVCGDSDWDGVQDSAPTCTLCHNVHGSPMDNGLGGLWANPVMIRHGELISTPGTTDKVPALDFSWKDGIGDFTNTLSDSRDGNMYCDIGAITNSHVCFGCHGVNNIAYTRVPNLPQ